MARAVGGLGAKPLRLLHVETSGGPFHVRIQETQGLPVFPQYVALSYCWGGDQPVKLTTDTLAKFKLSIPVATLPRTLQDAVSVCVQLGYNYLWIDALCILQDSNIEKATEIAKMPFIYGRADVTITASRAGSVGEGFLHARIPDAANRSAFVLPCVCSNGEVGKLNLVDLATDPEPIESRGWTFQERLLSPRIVEFGSRQTRWTCQEDRYSDGITDGWRKEVEWSPTKLQLTTLRHSLSATDGPDIGMWYHLVNIYCERKLTQSSDRPLAISGVAEWFGTLINDEYLAGIWKSHIHTGLLWAVPPLERLKRPQTFQGPSWSW
ncbi:heterokaryon incompatibility protein-domain-containing protein, partial [Dactylonectria macrodidyma]